MDHYIIKVYPVNIDMDYAVQVAWKYEIELKEIEEIEKKEKGVCDCYGAEKSAEKGVYDFYLGVVNKDSIPQIAELADTDLDGKLVFVIDYSFFSQTEPFYKGISKEYVEKPYRKLLKDLKADFHNSLFTYGKLDVTSELKEEVKEISRIAKALENDVAGDEISEALAGKMSKIKWICEKCGSSQTAEFLWEDMETSDGVKVYGSTPIKCENEKCKNVRLLVSYHSNITNLMKKMKKR